MNQQELLILCYRHIERAEASIKELRNALAYLYLQSEGDHAPSEKADEARKDMEA